MSTEEALTQRESGKLSWVRWVSCLSPSEERQNDVRDQRIFLSMGTEKHRTVSQRKISGRQKAAGWKARKEGRSQAPEGLVF